MKRLTGSAVIVSFLALALAAAAQTANTNSPATSASAQVPPVIQFSNVATDSGGAPLSGTVTITFALYNNSQGGEALWSEMQNVTLDNSGHYSVYLGITEPAGVPMSLFTTGQAHWLGVQIAGQTEQSRVFLVSVPYAMKAGDAATIGGLPPSAFVLAAPSNSVPAPAMSASAASSDTALPPTASDVTTSGGTANTLSLFSSANDIENSAITQTGTGTTAKIGIGTATPVSTLDIKGGSTVRGTLSLPVIGNATASKGYSSQPVKLSASAFNSGTGTAVAQNFEWQAEPLGNDTTAATGALSLLYGSGTTTPAATGLRISDTGQITFATGQTFPGTGTGNGTITGVTAGTDLTGGGETGTVTLNLDTSKVPQLAAANAFTGNQTVNGSVTATSFTGSGAGLTNLPGANVQGTVATANNALNLGGLPPASYQPAGAYATTGANTFTGNQTVTGNLTASGVVSGSSFEIGSNLFDYGSYANANAFLGFSGNTTMTGVQNTSTGLQALAGNTTGDYNTATGTQALQSNNTGHSNVADGLLALYQNLGGNYNVAIGNRSLQANIGGNDNAAVGYEALFQNTTGTYNSGLGLFAGLTVDSSAGTGNNDTAVGSGAGFSTGSLSNATALGSNAVVGESNALVLGAITGLNNGTSVNVGIGTTTPAYTLDVHGTANFTSNVTFSASQTFPGIATLTGSDAFTGNDTFTATSTDAIDAYTSAVGKTALVGDNTATTGGSYGVYAATSSPSGSGIFGANNSTSGGYGIEGYTAAPTGYAIAGFNGAGSGNGYGVYGHSDSSTGSGVAGVGQIGVNGSSSSNASGSAGVYGLNSTSSGVVTYGVVGVNQNSDLKGIGVAGTASTISATGSSDSALSRIGVWGDASDGLAGVLGTADNDYAIFATNNSGSSIATPALFAMNQSTTTGALALEAGFGPESECIINVDGDLSCSGSITANVSGADAHRLQLYGVASPENWFEDFGSGQLAGGKAKITLDPAFASTINSQNFHVFVTPNGDCKGLYVASKTAGGFEVRELGGGTSSISFDYRIVAKRRGYENVRLHDVTDQVNKLRQRQAEMRARRENAGVTTALPRPTVLEPTPIIPEPPRPARLSSARGSSAH